jgi:Ca2+-binding RTX toxin-like protein
MSRRRSFSPVRFEVLEDRRMRAGDITFANGILTVTGAGYVDTVTVQFEDDRVSVDLYAKDSSGHTDHHDKDKDISDVSQIIFNGDAGNDKLTVLVDDLDSDVTLGNVVLEFHGGADDDLLIQSAQGGVTTIASGDAGHDILWGGRFDDVLEGGAGNDDLHGGGGSDRYVFTGLALGTDAILDETANAGVDTLDFTDFGRSVTVDLAANFNFNGSPVYAVNSSNLRLTLGGNTAIENVVGTAFDDVIRGNSRDNGLIGGDGDDYIEGASGNDRLDGGAGNDVYFFNGGNLGADTINEAANTDTDSLNFAGFASGVNLDLTKYGAKYAVYSADLKLRLANDSAIENVYGSMFDDTITGNGRSNNLWGLDGNDTIRGGGGADVLYGGNGNDALFTDALDEAYGGTGTDLFDKFYEGSFIYRSNPQPGRYMDWGNTSTAYELLPKMPDLDATYPLPNAPVLPHPGRPETPEIQH